MDVYYQRFKTVDQRFAEKHEVVGECWVWRGRDREYPRFWVGTGYVRAHRYALEKKLGRVLESGEQALHTCDNVRCVNSAHLFVGSVTVNMQDRKKKQRGNHPRGEANGRAKLTAEQVVQIRSRYAAREKSIGALAAEYGLSQPTISALLLRQTWRHV